MVFRSQFVCHDHSISVECWMRSWSYNCTMGDGERSGDERWPLINPWACDCFQVINFTPNLKSIVFTHIKAGLVQSIVLMIIFAIMMCYTATLIANNCQRLIGKCSQIEDPTEIPEYTIMVGYYLGPVAEYVALINVIIMVVAVAITSYIILCQDTCV